MRSTTAAWLILPIDNVLNSPCYAGNLPGAVDLSFRDIKPRGFTPPYASPEVLHSLYVQYGDVPDDDELQVNGCAADMWSYGCILYELLTGVKPFGDAPAEFSVSAPSHVPTENVYRWLVCESVLRTQYNWVSISSYPIVIRALIEDFNKRNCPSWADAEHGKAWHSSGTVLDVTVCLMQLHLCFVSMLLDMIAHSHPDHVQERKSIGLPA